MSQQKRTRQHVFKCCYSYNGDPTSIYLEHLFNDLFALRDRFRELGLVMQDGNAYISDLEDVDN